MGGCGSAMCLLFSLLLFSRNRSNSNLSKVAAIPMLFNINELIIFGLPVVFNRHLFVPFIAMPLLGGYLATGSIAGSILQLFNLTLGIFVYKPFILMYEREKLENATAHMYSLIDVLKKSEETNVPASLLKIQGLAGLFAKMLASDLKYALERKELTLHYQPQYKNDGNCIGSEALLRWEHRIFGMIYPPLIIQLAEERDILSGLERFILEKAVHDTSILRHSLGLKLKTCVNITASTFYKNSFEQFLQQILDSGMIEKGDIWLELTEQKTILSGKAAAQKSKRIRAMGFPLVIGDFSMGHTSIKYLQNNEFDMVKPDGSLVRQMGENPRCMEIITSIVSLSRALNFTVLEEYVETEEQRAMLENPGCIHYQGYLYSPAVTFGEFLKKMRNTQWKK